MSTRHHGKKDISRYAWTPTKKGVVITGINLKSESDFGWHRRCPVCGEVKTIREFGLRLMPTGTVCDQPCCTTCRGKSAKVRAELAAAARKAAEAAYVRAAGLGMRAPGA